MARSGVPAQALEMQGGAAGAFGDYRVKPQPIGRSNGDDGAHLAEADGGSLPYAKKRVSLRKRCVWRTASTMRLLVKLAGVGLMGIVLIVAVVNWPPWIIEEDDARAQVLSSLFVAGLFVVALEDFVSINKSAVMLILASVMWTFLAVGYHPTSSEVGWLELHEELNKGIQDVGSVILFLLPAMGVVESIDHFDGFQIVTLSIQRIMDGRRERLIPIISVLTFFLSAVIDNLTSTIVALKILRHVAAEDKDWRRNCGGLAVIAANAGGAWSPIGDVTTTMLWIQGKITVGKTVLWLVVPSLFAGVFPMFGVWLQAQRVQARLPASSARGSASRGRRGAREGSRHNKLTDPEAQGAELEDVSFTNSEMADGEITSLNVAALVLGIVCILSVPALKMVTGLPPYMGMLLALGFMWLVTDTFFVDLELEDDQGEGAEPGEPGDLHGDVAESKPSPAAHMGPPRRGVMEALHKVDLTGLLFFAGVLLAVGAMNSAGVLHRYAKHLVQLCGGSTVLLCSLLGVSSAVVDNVPLVEASIDMFEEEGVDSPLWQLVALAAGTGGSMLSIGSISGVTLMSMEDVGFLWYCQRISPWAALGFALGIAVYQLERAAFG